MRVPSLIECEGHGLAPWSILCTHLLSGPPTEYMWSDGPPSHPEGLRDASCPECWRRYHDGESTEFLVCVCLHCARLALSAHKEIVGKFG